MTPQKTDNRPQIFQARLDQQLNMKHALVKLSGQIDWSAFEDKFGPERVPLTAYPLNGWFDLP